MEIVLATLISSFFGILGLMLFQRNKEKSMELKKKYEIELYTLKKKEARKDKKLAATIKTKPDSSIPELLKGLDSSKISSILGALQDNEEDEEDSLGGLGSIIANNPDLVNSFISGFKNKKTPEKNETELNPY